jgi:GNAT superfamily N-acetyltransferase
MIHAVDADEAVFSQLDSERFGIRAARAQVAGKTLSRSLDFCAAEKIDLLIARCTTNDLIAVQDMEAHGFLLMDTLVYYGFDLSRKSIPEDTRGFLVRQFQSGDKDQVRMVAAEAFRGYRGHYHADPRLDKRKCDETYASWAERSATLKSAADEVVIVEHGGRVVGFATLRKNSPQEGEGLLVAVVPEYQKRGVCQALMIKSLQWCRSQGAERMVISTQITNVAMQKVWCRIGFEPRCSYYTFHKWFD